MKALALILALCTPLAYADKVATNGGDELRLFDSPCAHGETLAWLDPQWRGKFKRAQALIGGKTVFGCWIDVPEHMAYFIRLENTEGFAIPMLAFTEQPGV
jgi:hypothetical protein